MIISHFYREGSAETSRVGGREPGGGHGRWAAGVVAARRAAARAPAPPVDHQVDGVDHVVGEPRRNPRHHHQQDGEPGPAAGGGRAEGRAAAPHLPLRHRPRRNRGHPCCTPPTRRFHRLAKLALILSLSLLYVMLRKSLKIKMSMCSCSCEITFAFFPYGYILL